MGSGNEKNIYLTFVLGFEAGYTGKILDDLKKNDVKLLVKGFLLKMLSN